MEADEGLEATVLVVTSFLTAMLGFTGTACFVCAQLETVNVVAKATNIIFFIMTVFKFRLQKYIQIPLISQYILNFVPYFTLFNPYLIEILTLFKYFIMNKIMKQRDSLMLIAFSILFMACGSESSTTPAKVESNASNTMDSSANAASEDSVISYDISLVDNKKDPTCGMPVTAGISDTAHYDNKVLGFCSVGCKEEFLKNPKANIAAAEIK
jgi:YHS domain-containing protein